MTIYENAAEENCQSSAYDVECVVPGHRLVLFRHQPHDGLHSQVIAGSVMPPDLSSTSRVYAIWAQGKPRGNESLPLFSCGAREPYTSSWSIPILGHDDRFVGAQIGRASCRERVCPYV